MASDAPSQRPPVVVVTGPTASGKTPIAIELARRFDGEIVNADSMQIYRHMEIGTAKPSLEQREAAPHHLLDVVSPDARYSAGRYLREARAAAASIHARGGLVLLTGGTGLYIRAFLEGLVETGDADAELREALENQHQEAVAAGEPGRLHARLAKTDPEAAGRIHPHDLKRTIRALELIEQGGRLASRQRGEHGFTDRPFRSLHLALDPGVAALKPRINARCVAMLEAGLLQEVRRLVERGYGFDLRPMQAIGYRHMQAVVEGEQTLEMVLPALQTDTRRFAKRQRTWLRKVTGVEWRNPDRPDEILAEVERFLEGGSRGGAGAKAEAPREPQST
jgi:tRNA dimethylallyltransferase